MRQKGFTFVELLLVMAIGAVLMAGMVTSIFQVSRGTVSSRDKVVALTDSDYASLWLRKDLQMVQSSDLTDGDPPESSVTLYWTDFTSWAAPETRDHSSHYALSGTDLVRTYDGAASIVARNITSVGFTRDGRVITCDITTAGPGQTEGAETIEFSVTTNWRSEDF